jgi:5,6,7,8-tetrahydromethanopterin hydro-lyase
MIYIGEGFEGGGPNAAHINLLLGPKDGPLATAWATAAASPGPGHIPFQAVLHDSNHENMTWGPAQLGVGAGITRALLDGILPAGAEDSWLAIALVWVNTKADDAEAVYANNKAAARLAAQRALMTGWPSRGELESALKSVGNPFFTPKNP